MLRTHTCGELRIGDVGLEVTLTGWVHTIRTHGNVTFIDLRDRYGITQVTLEKDTANEVSIHKEDVIAITGTVKKKPEQNKQLKTGMIELKAKDVRLLNKTKTLPLDIDNPDTTEETRLKYRFLDLRRPQMQANLLLRHKASIAIREYFDKQGFIEVETPILGKSTPEGARDYLVPSRVNPHHCFALPQSPQIFKQLLQVAGFDRYVQIVKCFRDEDLRADRQPEFTQIDLEMSFVEEEDIYAMMEGMIAHMWKKALDVTLSTPFPRITHEEAMLNYGSDKPDLRFDLPITDVTKWAQQTSFEIFKKAECVRALRVKGSFSRKQIDRFGKVVGTYGAKGLAWLQEGNEGGINKFVTKPPFTLEKEEYIFFVADTPNIAATALGALRLSLAKELKLTREEWNFVWVTEFPLMEWSEEDKRYVAMHHPFTSPRLEDRELLKSHPEKAKARAYDLTLNGVEIGGGSIRIHDQELQHDVFDALGINREEQERKFGFLLDALSYGAPPHGGIAFGFDRLIMLLVGADNIREVIAFPKTKDAEDLMMQAPSTVDEKQLKELGMKWS